MGQGVGRGLAASSISPMRQSPKALHVLRPGSSLNLLCRVSWRLRYRYRVMTDYIIGHCRLNSINLQPLAPPRRLGMGLKAPPLQSYGWFSWRPHPLAACQKLTF